MSDVGTLKVQGNKAFQAKDYDKAIQLFTDAIKIDPNNHVLYSNRSAAYAGKREWSKALEDAEACIKANPSWSKGYSRKGAALHGAHRWEEAIAAYEEGLKIEDSPALRKGLKEVQDAKAAEEPNDEEFGLGKLFRDPNLLEKLRANPRTQRYLDDPAFVESLIAIQKDPTSIQSALQDTRMIEVMGVLMNVDLQAYNRNEGGPTSAGPPPSTSEGFPRPPTYSNTPSSSQVPPVTPVTPVTEPAKVEEDVEMAEEEDEEAAEERKRKLEAETQKRLGNDAYSRRDFAAATTAFEKAWETWPKDVTYLTNLSAALLEQGEFDKCIEVCEKAVEEGRSLRADYKIIAKAYGRIGTAHAKKGDLTSAIKFYQKSLTEHRTPDILNKLRDAEKQKEASDVAAYINPELSAKAREGGNALFKSGDFAGAVKLYTESIKRDPNDPRGYNNRALCYTKLAALPEALKDAEEAIKVDPKFVKAYIRKSNVLFSMREYEKAIEAIQEAAEHDDDGKSSDEIQKQMSRCSQALMSQRASESEEDTLNRAMRDPEVASIMNDPVMQQILQQAQQNPGALQDHMKNPIVKNKILKLVNAGIIKTR